MRETYHCLDGREALLRFDEDALTVTATARDGAPIGEWRFALTDAAGQQMPLLEDSGEPAGIKLAEWRIDPAWEGQGISERVGRLVRDETGLQVG